MTRRSWTPSANLTLTTITEDETTNTGHTVAQILASGGTNPITDVNTGAVEGIAITSLSQRQRHLAVLTQRQHHVVIRRNGVHVIGPVAA